MDYGTFHLGPAAYAVPLESLQEVLHQPRLSPVPLGPENLLGMTLWRSQILPVFELACALGPDRPPFPSRSRVLVLSHHGLHAGIAADTTATLTSSTPLTPPQRPGLRAGHCGQFSVLDLDALFNHLTTALTSAVKGFQPRRPQPSSVPAHV